MNLNEREASIVLCGLRMLQAFATDPAPADVIARQGAAFQMILEDEGHAPIDPAEIDALCEKINFS